MTQQPRDAGLAADELIPHRSPIQMIDTLLHWTADSACGSVTFSQDHMGVMDGFVSEPALIEAMAQTLAAMESANARQQDGVSKGRASSGVLCGVSRFDIKDMPRAGMPLTIEVMVEKRLGPMMLASGCIRCQGKIVASGQLQVRTGEDSHI